MTQALKAGLKALKSVAHTEAGKNWGILFRADFLRGNVENLKILKLLEPMEFSVLQENSGRLR